MQMDYRNLSSCFDFMNIKINTIVLTAISFFYCIKKHTISYLASFFLFNVDIVVFITYNHVYIPAYLQLKLILNMNIISMYLN